MSNFDNDIYEFNEIDAHKKLQDALNDAREIDDEEEISIVLFNMAEVYERSSFIMKHERALFY